MLEDYESDHHTGMDTTKMAHLLSEYTSGYPFLVSRLCMIIDEKLNANWTEQGFLEAQTSAEPKSSDIISDGSIDKSL